MRRDSILKLTFPFPPNLLRSFKRRFFFHIVTKYTYLNRRQNISDILEPNVFRALLATIVSNPFEFRKAVCEMDSKKPSVDGERATRMFSSSIDVLQRTNEEGNDGEKLLPTTNEREAHRFVRYSVWAE